MGPTPQESKIVSLSEQQQLDRIQSDFNRITHPQNTPNNYLHCT